MAVGAQVFSRRERALLLAVAEAALPAGKAFPAADAGTVWRVEQLLATQPSSVTVAYRGLLRLLDGLAWLRRRSSFTALPVAARLAALETWRAGSLLRRGGLRALTLPLKMAHFDDPRFYRH